jgi:putative DNA primase/helicase
LFYLPRRPPGGVVPETSVITGNHCDIFALPKPNPVSSDLLSNTKSRASASLSVDREFADKDTGELIDLQKWARVYGSTFLICEALYSRKKEVFTRHNVDGKVHIDCPNQDAHTSPDRDYATYIMNGSRSSTKGFVVHCRHGHCTEKDRLFFVRKMLEKKWLQVEDLTAEQFQAAEPAKDEPKKEDVKKGRNKPVRSTKNLSGMIIRILAGELHRMTSEAEEAIMASDIPIYQRGTILVRPIVQRVPASKGRFTISASLHQIGAAALIDELSACAGWERYDARAEAWVAANPPKQVADILLSRAGLWTLPSVVGVVTCPTLRPDGSILSAPGYDLQTRLYHAADQGLTLLDATVNPTKADAVKALVDLETLLAEFPTVGDIDRAVALSGLITPVVRGAMAVAPLHAFRASTAGTGKSYLVDTASAISTGRPCPVATAAADEGETEKRIAGLLLGGFPIASIDNVNGDLGGDLLCQAIERPMIRIRQLGASDILEIESRATFFATGNALRVKGDMVRRALICDLDAGVERPETREFKGDPMGSVMAERGRYVSAALIIVRAYIIAGKPECLPKLASFEEWSDLVRSALVWLGCADPVASMESAREDDPELSELRQVILAWSEIIPDGYEFTAKKLIEKAEERHLNEYNEKGDFINSSFRDALMLAGGDRGILNSRKLGNWLARKAGRMVGNQRIVKGKPGQGGIVVWSIKRS